MDVMPEKAFVDNIRRTMSAFPEIVIDKMESSKQSLFSQQWPTSATVFPEVSDGYASPRLQTPRAKFWQPGLHPISNKSSSGTLMQDGVWHDPLQTESSASHGLDEFHMQQLLQLEKLQLHQQLELSQSGIPHPHQSQQQHHLLQELLNQLPVSHLDQRSNPVIPPDVNTNIFHHLPSSHPLQQLASPHQLPSSHMSSRLQQQSNFESPATGPHLEERLRLQQQLLPSHPLLEQFSRQQQQFPPSDQLRIMHNNTRVTDMHMHQLEHLHQRSSEDPLLQLLLQRQQEEELQNQQRAYLLQQQQMKLDEQRVSGVWEVNEFGQFVRTQASVPMQPNHEAFLQQQLHLLQRNSSFPEVHHWGQSLHVDLPGLHNSEFSQMQSPKLGMQRLVGLQQPERDISALLSGVSRTELMPTSSLSVHQAQRPRFEGHNNLPSHSLMPFEAELFSRNQSFPVESNEAAAGRGWKPQDVELDLLKMYGRDARINQQNRQQQSSGMSWQQDIDHRHDHIIEAQRFSNAEHLMQISGDNQDNVLRMQQLQGNGHLQLTSQELLRLLCSPLPSDTSALSNSMFMNEASSIPKPSSDHYQLNPFPQPSWDGVMPSNNIMATNITQDEADVHMEPHICVPLSSELPSLCLQADSWIKSGIPIQEDPEVISSFDVQAKPIQYSSVVLSANGNVDNAHDIRDEDVSASMSPSFHRVTDDSDIGETKDTKKNKKGVKGKAGKMVAVPLPDSPVALYIPEKTSEMTMGVDEWPPAVIPSNPSLGHDLPIKEERGSSLSSSAWSMAPNQQSKTPKSLKQIQELEKKARDEQEQNLQVAQQIQSVSPSVSSPAVPINNNTSAWQRPLLSTLQSTGQSKAQTVSQENPKSKMSIDNDDELFWNYTDAENRKQSSKSER